MIPIGTTLEQKRLPRVTLTIVVANFAIFFCEPLLFNFMREERFLHLTYGTKSPSVIGLFTSIFLHGSFLHVFFNNLYLWVFGPAVEERVGGRDFFLYYMGAGIAANFLSLFVDVAITPDRLINGLGASGAISGVLALYAYRCWHGKISMLVPLVGLPLTLNIPAVPFLIIWFMKNVFSGIASITRPDGIGHWAHVGGFLFGLVVGRIKRYGHEAAVEHYSGRLLNEMRAGMGWKGMKDASSLLKLAKLSPEDPEVRLQLAQYYAATGETAQACGEYREAIQKFFVRNPLYAAFALLERMDAACGIMGLSHHLRAAEALAAAGFFEEAHRALGPAMDAAREGALAPKAQLLFIRLCRELGRDDEAQEAFKRLAALSPASAQLEEARRALSLGPGSIFPKKDIALPASATRVVEKPGNASATDVRVANGMNKSLALLSDPVFFFSWLALLPVVGLFGGHVCISLLVVTPLAMLLRFFLRPGERGSGVSEKDVQRAQAEADASTLLNRAMLADRGEDFPKAAELYEKYLHGDPLHIQARFNLARIYHKRLNDRNNALRQYRKLLEVAPPDHPYRHEAEMAVEGGCRNC